MHDNDDEILEKILTRGLAAYANAEPRAGLEQRILATVAADQPKFVPSRWRWAIASLLLASLLVSGFVWQHLAHREPASSIGSSLPAMSGSRSFPRSIDRSVQGVMAPLVAKDASPKALFGRHAGHPQETRQRQMHPVATGIEQNRRPLPKLDQFPSPSPLTDEERALIAFTTQHPEAAEQLIEAQKRDAGPIQVAEIRIARLSFHQLKQGEKDEDAK